MILAPVAKQLPKRVLIVGDDVLQYLPFGALPDPARGYSVPLALAHEVVHLPSAAAAAAMQRRMRNRKPASQTLAVLADPVFDALDPRVISKEANIRPRPRTLEPGLLQALHSAGWNSRMLPRLPLTRREAQSILSLLPTSQTLALLDFDATRQAVLSGMLRDYRIVHMAAHGLLNTDDPDKSGIAFSLVHRDGRPNNGFLSVGDIYALDLPAELVVLSACQTALGTSYPGHAVFGLTSAFLAAGAKRVISTAWKIDDAAAAALMKVFYAEMLGSRRLSPAAALARAQSWLMKQEQWKHPFYWAGFVAHGQWR